VTWLDSQPRHQVEAALEVFDQEPELAKRYVERAGHDRRYRLWLALVDLQISTLPDRSPRLAWDCRTAYRAGWSPRAAAFAAWASTDTDSAAISPIVRAGHTGGIPR